VILKFSLVISLVCNKDTDIDALVVSASVSHHRLVLSDLSCVLICVDVPIRRTVFKDLLCCCVSYSLI